MKLRLLSVVVVVMTAGLGLFAAGCGDDDGPAEPTATLPPGFTPLPEGFLTPQPPPALDPNVELLRFQGEKWPYNIGYPAGWEPHVDGPSVDEFVLMSEYGQAAALHVRCGRSVSQGNAEPEGLARDDSMLISTVSYQAGEPEVVSVNGRHAVKWSYSVAIPGTPVRSYTLVYYIKGDDDRCSWRVSLQTLGIPPLEGYQELLDRIVEEFEPGVSG